MQLNSTAALYGGYVDSLPNKSIPMDVLTSIGTSGSSGFSGPGQASDSSQLSSLAQIFSALQLLQENNKPEYQQATQKIASKLKTAAKSAESDGNVSAASQLSQLASEFGSASVSGELPSVQDVASAIGEGYVQGQAANDSEDLWNLSGASETTNLTTNEATNPVPIILQSLSAAVNPA